MKLYYMPGACSLAVHIALREARLPFTLAEVDYATRRTSCGRDFFTINPAGCVPALELRNGQLLTEVPVLLQYIDGLAPEAALLPKTGVTRLRALIWLSYIATEIHKSFSPLFRPTTPVAFLGPGKDHLIQRIGVVERHLSPRRFLLGSRFSLADGYLFTVCRWLEDQNLSLQDWPALRRHFEDMSSRPAVMDALAAEGIRA